MIGIESLGILLLLNLFIIGIKSLSINLLYKYKILSLNNNLNISSNFAIASLLGTFFYCILTNFILILPSLLFFINHSFFNFEYIVGLIINVVKLSFFIVAFIGLIDFLKIFDFLNQKKESHKIKEYTKFLLIGLLIADIIYLFISPKSISSGIIYDTGLYHLPFVNHLSKYAIEPGLANLHIRYGFYGLSFYGQVALQSLYKNSQYLSPSINIGFMAIYLSYFISYFEKIKISNIKNKLTKKVILNENIENISILYFVLSLIFYTGGIFKSLSSYSLDLPLFICGSLTFHLLIISLLNNENLVFYRPILWLSFFAPIIKLTGIVVPIYSFIFFIIKLLKLLLKSYNFKDINNFLRKINFNIIFNNKIPLALILLIFLIYVFNNVVITGFPFFPSNILGPTHNYAINSESLKLLSSDTLSWHRYQGAQVNSENWIYSYLITRNGLLNIIFWFLPSIFSILSFQYLYKYIKNKNYKLDLFNLFLPLLILQFLCFLNLIPLVNYYPWFPHCSLFIVTFQINRIINLKNLNINLTKLIAFILIIFIVANSYFSFSNRVILANLTKSFLKEPLLENTNHQSYLIKPKKWISLKNYFNNKKIKISIPKGTDQCWGIDPPCTTNVRILKKLEF